MLNGKLHVSIAFLTVFYTMNSLRFYGILDNEGLGANLNMVSTFWNEIVLKQNREFVLVPFKSEHWGYYISLCDYFKLPIHVSCVNKLPWEIINEKECYAENSNEKWKLRLNTYSLDYFKNKSLSQLVYFRPKLDINNVECGILKQIRIKDDSLFFPFKNLPLEFNLRSVHLYNQIKNKLNFERNKFF